VFDPGSWWCNLFRRVEGCATGQVLHGSATTTEAVRRAIQHSEESLRALAQCYGVNPKTIGKWRKRSSVADLPTGPREPKSSVLSVEEEAIIVVFRRHTLLPLDDCLYALQATIPHLTRSSLHRCLQRHGVSLPEVEGDKTAKKKFKSYAIGFFHIDIAEVRTKEGKLYLFVGIDRTSKFAFVQLHEQAPTAVAFLEALIAATPYRLHTILTDNGIQFADLPRNRNGWTARYRVHRFDQICREHRIEHRLTKPNHLWTTDVIDKWFFAGSELFSSRARATAWRRAGREAQALPRSLHCRPSVAAPVRARLGPRGFQPATKRAYRLGLLDPPALLIAMALDIVSVSSASLAAFGFITRLQLQIAQLPGVQRRSGPHVAFTFAQQMPDEHRELTGRRDSGDMLTATGADSQEECTQRTRRSRCRPGGLDEHASGMAAALLGDPAVISRSGT
jgi:Integrase core domain